MIKKVFGNICIAAVVTITLAANLFGSGRPTAISMLQDSLLLHQTPDTITKKDVVVGKFDITIKNDSSYFNTIAENTKYIHPRDTMKAPDSLKLTDPFRYQYYVAIKDSLTHIIVRDSLLTAGDTIASSKVDSLYLADSTYQAEHSFAAWYASLSKKEKRKYNFEKMLPIKKHRMDSILAAKDSLRAVKDSIIENTPRILDTYAIPDSLHYKRIIMWTHERDFNSVQFEKLDTTYNYRYNDLPYMKNDVGAISLGIPGSPGLTYNYMKRKSNGGPAFHIPEEMYGYSPQTLPMYNTKTPYTELAYTGTLFANKDKEQDNIRVFTTQNILPELNMTISYDRYGGGGMLRHERTDNRTFTFYGNYMGKRYKSCGGYIYNKMAKDENGGIVDNFWIRDTTVDAKEIEVHLKNAESNIKKHTYFYDQEYKIPINFLNKLKEKHLLRRKRKANLDINELKDSINIDTLKDTIDVDTQENKASMAEESTTNIKEAAAYIGTFTEYSFYKKIYRDKIDLNDEIGRKYYNDRFYYNPIESKDSLRAAKFENKIYLRLQPWSSDAIVSGISAGIGYKRQSYYVFDPTYLHKFGDKSFNNSYIYASTGGRYKQYFDWNALGSYTYVGEEQNDFRLEGNMDFQFFPFRKAKKSPIALGLHFETSLKTPDYYQKHFFSNHVKWDKDFDQTSLTKLQAVLNIPHWRLSAEFGTALLKNNIFYNNLGIACQNGSPMSIVSLALNKNFTVARILHFDHRLLLQYTSDEDVIPLPAAALDFRYYAQFNLVKNVMQVQLGVDAMYNTKWYAPGYNPATGGFHTQKEEKYGGCPYLTAFANIQWKRACIFVRVENIGMGWPMSKADYFSAHNYIRPQKSLKFGIFWPFYVGPKRNSTVKTSGSLGGGSGAAGGGFGGLNQLSSGMHRGGGAMMR